MARPKILSRKFQIYCTDAFYDRISNYANQNGLSLSSACVTLVNQQLDNYDLLGMIFSDPDDISDALAGRLDRPNSNKNDRPTS